MNNIHYINMGGTAGEPSRPKRMRGFFVLVPINIALSVYTGAVNYFYELFFREIWNKN
jgi:hypothetical protein